MNWQQDPNGNWLARFVFPERTTEFSITVDLLADMSVINPFDFFVDPSATNFPFVYPAEFDEELAPYLSREAPGPLLAEYVKSISREPQTIIDFLVALNQRLQRDIRYLVRMDPGVQAPEDTLKLASGSCRDTAWLLVQILRHLGLAARFVSGYLIQLVPDLKALDGPAGSTQDFTDLHAWTEVYHSGRWLDRARSDLGTAHRRGPYAARRHAALPRGRADQRRRRGGRASSSSSSMKIDRVDEKPRVTFPFSDEAWNALDALGDRVEADLNAQDVRLTMGGEPTFVSIDDYESAEWNIAAVGPTKRILADQLIRRLRDRFAPGGLHPSWAGQMVSRRAAAALGVLAVLADRRQADLAGRSADRDREAV